MVVTLKLNKGTVEKLIEWKIIKPEQPRNLTDKELTLELDNKDVLIELHKKENIIEIADLNGSFSIWFELTDEKLEKLREALEKGP
jgi:hypothetical protein